MTKSQRLRTLSLIGLLLFLVALTSPAAPRHDLRLDSGWLFLAHDASGAEAVGFDDHQWQSVTLPDNWGWQDAQAGRNYYRGPGWYRRELDVLAEPGKRYFLRFEAASLVANVYLV